MRTIMVLKLKETRKEERKKESKKEATTTRKRGKKTKSEIQKTMDKQIKHKYVPS
jgi:hypothetical protein